MVTNDATILKVKHDLLYRIAKLAFEGTYEEHKDQIPYEMIPGPHAQFRCCIYKEREVLRQRIRLAEGKNPVESDSKNVVQIIPAACEGCPITRYVVTDNCQKCMGKACQNSCNFGAITIGKNRAYIDGDLCRECGKCAPACPYNAIADLVRPCRKSCPVDAIIMDEETGIAVIDESKCIQCGACVHSCPFGAIGTKTAIVQIIEAMKKGKKVVAMVAPSIEGQFGEDISMSSIRTALKKIGFADMIEVSLGGDLTTVYEAKEWMEAYKEGKKMTTSCCPAFVNMIHQHFPTLTEHISTTVSPMCGVSRMLKAQDPDTVTVFIGPCIAKKSEAANHDIEGNADYVLTVGEMRAMLKAKDVQFEKEDNDTQQGSIYGKRFGNGGGVTQAVLRSLEEEGITTEIKVEVCDGAAECKKALLLLRAGRLNADFIEGMACPGGCVGGPSKHDTIAATKKSRDKLIGEADDRGIKENLEKRMQVDLNSFSMHRH